MCVVSVCGVREKESVQWILLASLCGCLIVNDISLGDVCEKCVGLQSWLASMKLCCVVSLRLQGNTGALGRGERLPLGTSHTDLKEYISPNTKKNPNPKQKRSLLWHSPILF